MRIQYRRDLWKVIQAQFGNATCQAAEIGVAEGYFSADMLSWPINLSRLYMVDRWQCVSDQKGDASNSQEWHDTNLAAARARVKQFGDRAVFLQGSSIKMAEQVADRSLMLAYIDADHTYQGVLFDSLSWLPKVVPGGYMAFHDYENANYGVKEAVNEFCRQNGFTIHLLPEDAPEDAGAYFQVI